MTKKILFIFFTTIFSLSYDLYAQTILDDAKGGNLLVGYLNGIMKGNIADGSLSFGYSINIDRSTLDLSLKGKASNGLANLVSVGKLTPETLIEFGFSYNIADMANSTDIDTTIKMYHRRRRKLTDESETKIKDAVTKKDSSEIQTKYDKQIKALELEERSTIDNKLGFVNDKIGILFGYNDVKYSLFNSNVTFKNQITKQQFEAGLFKIYNTSFFRSCDMLLTEMITIKRNNNIGDLSQKTLTITQQTKDSTGSNTNSTKQDIPVWVGNYETFTSVDATIGMIVKPWDDAPVGLSAFVRYNSWMDSKKQKFGEIGIGIHILDDTKIFSPKVGLMVQYSGKQTGNNIGADVQNQLSLNMTASLPFSF